MGQVSRQSVVLYGVLITRSFLSFFEFCFGLCTEMCRARRRQRTFGVYTRCSCVVVREQDARLENIRIINFHAMVTVASYVGLANRGVTAHGHAVVVDAGGDRLQPRNLHVYGRDRLCTES